MPVPTNYSVTVGASGAVPNGDAELESCPRSTWDDWYRTVSWEMAPPPREEHAFTLHETVWCYRRCFDCSIDFFFAEMLEV